MYLKFLSTEHIDFVLQDGTLVVSSLQYFRKLEETRGPWIGDRLEGASELVTPSNFTLTERSPELERINQADIGSGMFAGQFAAINNGGKIEIANVSFVHQLAPLFIYSFSNGELPEMKTRMCVEAQEPYDACLQILDPAVLAQAICDSGETSDGQPFRAQFIGIRHEPVRYEAVSQNIMSANAIPPSPFRKAPHFSLQREERFVLVPKSDIDLGIDRITIRIPNPSKYFEEVFRGNNSSDLR